MSKKQFTLDSWLKDKSQKVVTRCRFPVRIVCTDVKRKDYPILALVERDDQEEYQSFTKDGRFSLYNPLHDNFDLFIETADEVSEDEKILEIIKHCIESRYLHTSTIKGISQKQCLTWLEKQGEKDILEDAILDGYILDGNEDGLIAETIRFKNEKQGEQKPEMKTAEESLGVDSETYNKIVDECIFGEQNLAENAKPQSSTPMSYGKELEKRMCEACNRFFAPNTDSNRYSASDLFYAGVKAERDLNTLAWSEDDEQHIDSLLKRLDALCRNKFERTRFAISEDRDWLKSLKERKGGKI